MFFIFFLFDIRSQVNNCVQKKGQDHRVTNAQTISIATNGMQADWFDAVCVCEWHAHKSHQFWSFNLKLFKLCFDCILIEHRNEWRIWAFCRNPFCAPSKLKNSQRGGAPNTFILCAMSIDRRFNAKSNEAPHLLCSSFPDINGIVLIFHWAPNNKKKSQCTCRQLAKLEKIKI